MAQKVRVGFTVLAFVFVLAAQSEAAKKNCDKSLAAQEPVASLAAAFERFELADLLSADLETNLAVRFPAMLMDAALRTHLSIAQDGVRQILEPTYRVRKVPFYPAFAEGGPLADGHLIVGHYEALGTLARFFAQGESRRVFLARGGAGTGKTESLGILARRRANLSNRDPRFRELTFEWHSLDQIPSLKAWARTGTRAPDIQRSPLVLLPPATQARVVDFASPAFVENFGVNPRPFLQPDPQTAEVIREIMKHRFGKDGRVPTEAEYLQALSQHVVIVRRQLEAKDRPGVVGLQGKNPQLSRFGIAEDIVAMSVYGPRSALSYSYSGLIPRADGGVLCPDELFRQPPEVRDYLLELFQNHRLEMGAAPPVTLDLVMVAASNEESIADALAVGNSKALLDRAMKVPMRASIHPMQIAPLALQERGRHGAKFVQWKLGETARVDVPYRMLDVFPPEPTPKGTLLGAEGRYGLAVVTQSGRRLVLAPQALMIIAMTAAGTRLVTDPNALRPFSKEFDVLAAGNQFFEDPATRLEVILGIVPAEASVRRELEKLQGLLAEGEEGISARQLDIWVEAAIALGEETGAVTPLVVTRAFQRLLDHKGLEAPTPQQRAKWISVHDQIKYRLALPAITADVIAIFNGDPLRLKNLYDEVSREIVALSNDPQAQDYSTEGGERYPINRERLRDIERIYSQTNKRNLVYAELRNFAFNHRDELDPALMRALQEYVLQVVVNVDGLGVMIDAFSGRTQDPNALRRAADARVGMNLLGYDEVSFVEALRFVHQQQVEKQRRAQREGQ